MLTASTDHTAAVMTIDPKTLSFGDVVRLQPERLAEGTAYVAMSMATDDQAKYLYIGNADSIVRIWDVRRGVQTGEVVGTGLNDTLAVSGDGTLVLSGSNSPKAKAILWKVDPTRRAKAKMLHRLRGHDQAVTSLAISNDGKLLFTGDSVGYGIVWDAKTGKPIGPPIENVRGFRVNAAQFASDAKSLWLGSDDGQLTQVDLATRRNLRRLNHDGFVTEISLSKDQKHAVTVSELLTKTQLVSKATFWDLQTKRSVTLARSSQRLGADRLNAEQPGRNTGTSNGSSNRSRARVTAAAFGQSGHSVVVCQTTAKGRSAIKVWKDVSRSSVGKPDQALALPSRLGVTQAVLPLTQGRCVTLSQNSAFAWKLSTGKLLHSYRAHAGLTEAAFSPDGKWIATASRSVKFWDSSTGQPTAKIESPHIGPVRSVDFQPVMTESDQYKFATSGDDGVVRFWNWKPGKPPVQDRHYDLGSGTKVNFVRYSSDGKRLLLGGDAGAARILSLNDTGLGALDVKNPSSTKSDQNTKAFGKVLRLDIDDSETNFLCGAFSSDGTHVALGGDDDLARVWTVEKLNQTPSSAVIMKGHADAVNDIKISGDLESGYRVFTASADDSVKVWDPRKIEGSDSNQGREILSLQKHRSDVTAIDMSDDGRLMMTAGSEGQVILWPAQPVEEISDQLFE